VFSSDETVRFECADFSVGSRLNSSLLSADASLGKPSTLLSSDMDKLPQ
jgi:hypothetical protein